MNKTHQKVHSKRVRRNALRNANRYRAKAAFFKQRNDALLKDLGLKGQDLKEEQANLLSRNKQVAGLRSDLVDANCTINKLESLWFVRVFYFLTGKVRSRRSYFVGINSYI